MFFIVKNKRFLSQEQLRTNTLLNAYFVIHHYPLKASDQILDQYLQQQYKVSLKNMCIKLILSLTFYKDNDDNLILMFKDQNYDKLAQLITYGNGAIQGSRILQLAFNS